MRVLSASEVENVSGGWWQFVVATYAALEIADAVYTAVQAGVESYEQHRQPQSNMGQL